MCYREKAQARVGRGWSDIARYQAMCTLHPFSSDRASANKNIYYLFPRVYTISMQDDRKEIKNKQKRGKN